LERNIHVIGVDPGGTTGWARMTVPRLSLFGDQGGEVIEWEYGEFSGSEYKQAGALARLARETQSLAYKIGPAIVVEDWDIEPVNRTTDPSSLSPVRIGAMLVYAQACGHLSDARVLFQGRTLAKGHMTDERLKEAGFYVKGSDHVRDATRHALTFLRRAKHDRELRESAWNCK
jgi:hypothetical protein